MKIRKASKFLSLILRHQPQSIGLQLDKAGWANVDELLTKMNQVGHQINREGLENIVENNDKQRFSFSDDGSKIRANQGHSIPIELGYEAKIPPTILYHGTAVKNKAAILEKGIDKRQRHHVHLSSDKITATKVGQRHGQPFLFVVLSGEMHKAGIPFYESENGVWLTEYVDPQYLSDKD